LDSFATSRSLTPLSHSSTIIPDTNEDGEQSDLKGLVLPTEEPKTVSNVQQAPVGGPENAQASAAQPEQKPAKKITGWPSKLPFYRKRQKTDSDPASEYIYWKSMTWREKLEFKKQFYQEYFRETKKSIPFAKRLFLMIIRISPWRAVALLAVTMIRSLMPALTLQTRGTFLHLV